jgi:hypothetical protein
MNRPKGRGFVPLAANVVSKEMGSNALGSGRRRLSLRRLSCRRAGCAT